MKNVMQHLTRVVVALVAITTAGLAGAAYDFVNLNYEGMTGMQVFGTNDRGLVTGNAFFADGPNVPFVYDPKKQTFTELPSLPGCELGAMAINNSGVVAGTCSVSPNLSDGFILKNGKYTRFAYPGFACSEPRGISSTGLVTGYATTTNELDGTFVGFIYDPARGTFTDIGFPGMYNWIIVQGINARGRAVGNVFLPPDYVSEGSPGGSYGFVREPSGLVSLFRVNGQSTYARGINDAGVIVGYTYLADGSVCRYARRLGRFSGDDGRRVDRGPV
jgi:hypothetical protein